MDKDLELDLDIKYVKNIINKCFSTYKNTKIKLFGFDKKYSSRIYFICFQFRNIFDSRLWL